MSHWALEIQVCMIVVWNHERAKIDLAKHIFSKVGKDNVHVVASERLSAMVSW